MKGADKMVKEKDFREIAKERYEQLLKEVEARKGEIEALENEINPLRAYLQGVGLIEKKRRKRRTKAEMGKEQG